MKHRRRVLLLKGVLILRYSTPRILRNLNYLSNGEWTIAIIPLGSQHCVTSITRKYRLDTTSRRATKRTYQRREYYGVIRILQH